MTAAIYSASLIEEIEPLQESSVRLLRRFGFALAFEVKAHPSVEEKPPQFITASFGFPARSRPPMLSPCRH